MKQHAFTATYNLFKIHQADLLLNKRKEMHAHQTEGKYS